ncbi:hypothetical protein SCHPADRAFT_560056 [Schizopora paradoxa]|uniref:Uncharacterized protein n=1 Tax=Schizopora paradoxa TaxID=27342 RepID=A0A0H2RCM8_9AGAM|nr:hypothetical protein SCHPADRAFT_560056 [Schizopora paradoxa]
MAEQSLYPLPPSIPSRSSSVGQRVESEGPNKYKSAPPRATKYKEKFHALRETYDLVTAKHEEHQRELELANAKLRKLQAENEPSVERSVGLSLAHRAPSSLLLDAMMLVASGQPTLLPYLDRSLTQDQQSQSPNAMNDVDMNVRSHAPGYPANADSMDYDQVNSDYYRPPREVNGRHN